MTRTEALLAAVALALAGCDAAVSRPPRPAAVSPSAGFGAGGETVVIRGDGFFLRGAQDLDRERSEVTGAYRAWIGGRELEAVAWIDETSLSGRVPPGLPVGRHDVDVEGPFGRGLLAGGYEVLSGTAAVLAAAIVAPPAATVDQQLTVELTIESGGGGRVTAVQPLLEVSGSGSVELVAAPAGGLELAAGERRVVAWTYRATAPGTVVFTAGASGSDPRTGGTVAAAPASASVLLQRPAVLEASARSDRTSAAVGQTFTVTLEVTNAGGTEARQVVPTALPLEFVLVQAPPPPPQDVAPGATATFTWTFLAIGAGNGAFAFDAVGADATSGAPVAAARAATAPVWVEEPAALAAYALASPAQASTGGTVTVSLHVHNYGAVAADVLPSIAVLGTAILAGTGEPQAQRIEAGGGVTLVWTFRATAPGTATFAARVEGVDTTGMPASATATTSPIAVLRPAALSATLTLPGSIDVGDFTATMTVANTGDELATGVFPGPLAVEAGSTAPVTLVAAPSLPLTIAGGASEAFEWTYRATAPGTIQLSGGVSGTDANDGGTRTASAVSNLAIVQHAARVVAVNPLGDGSPFAFVTGFHGQAYVGPSRNGKGMARMQPDGSGLQSLGLSFSRDAVGTNQSTNTAPPFASIGHYGCTSNSAADACGPDNENGRGLLTSVTIAGEEWLVLGGARLGGDLDYVYMARGDVSPLSFSYVDLSSVLGGNTRGFSAALAHGGRLYLGFSDNGGNRPYGLALLGVPSAPGLDALPVTHVLDLDFAEAFKKALGSFASIAMVDAIAELNGRLYFFNNVGCIVSTTSTPATKDHFAGCSPPTSAAYDQKGSIPPTQQHDLEPHDRAWPQVAVWKGRLYAIRNTSTGPQLWGCDPARGGDPAVCEPADWSLVASDGSNRSRFGKPGATAATLLVATPKHLYVGLDDESGIHVFRSSAGAPLLAADFTGHDGCVAGTSGCQGLGGDGFGDPTLRRIFDAKAITAPDGSTSLVLTAGNGADPVRVIRISN